MRTRVIVAVLVAGVALGMASSPASAQTKLRKDQVGDAAARVDIRSVKVQNNEQNFAITVRIQRVQKRRTGIFATFSTEVESEYGTSLEVRPISKGRFKLIGRVGLPDGTRKSLACGRLAVKTGKRGYFRIVVPQDCLGPLAGRQTLDLSTYDKKNLNASGPKNADSLRSSMTVRRG